MKKQTLLFSVLALSLSACQFFTGVHQYPTMRGTDAESGTLVQGSRWWMDANVCDKDVKVGPCVRVINGPVIIEEVRASETCPGDMTFTVKGTWGDDEIPSFILSTDGSVALVARNLELEADESLFVGTQKSSVHSKNGSCYVTWTGHRK